MTEGEAVEELHGHKAGGEVGVHHIISEIVLAALHSVEVIEGAENLSEVINFYGMEFAFAIFAGDLEDRVGIQQILGYCIDYILLDLDVKSIEEAAAR
jgi:hypothetical protein